MSTRERELVSELSEYVIKRLRDCDVKLYEAMRIIGYITVALAETIEEE